MTSSIPALLERIRQCRDCSICPQRTPVVYGSVDSRIMIVSEVPPKGAWKNNLGEEWKISLDNKGWKDGTAHSLCKWLGLDSPEGYKRLFWIQRSNCYASYGKGHVFLHCSRKHIPHAIRTVKPELIITLGRTAAEWFYQFNNLWEVVGKQISYKDGDFECPVIAFFHPSKANAFWRSEYSDVHKDAIRLARSIIKRMKWWPVRDS